MYRNYGGLKRGKITCLEKSLAFLIEINNHLNKNSQAFPSKRRENAGRIFLLLNYETCLSSSAATFLNALPVFKLITNQTIPTTPKAKMVSPNDLNQTKF